MNDYKRHLIINGVPIKNPHDMGVDSYNLTKSGRNADGKMSMDIIAKKTTIDVSYSVLSAKDMDTISRLIDGGSPFFKVEYLYEGVYKSMTAYSGAIHRKMFRTSGGWYWKDVSFALIEQ